MQRKAYLLSIAIGFWMAGHAQVWQWSTEVDGVVSQETNDHPRAFLWIPENCRQVRGVVVGQHNMLEEGIFEHPAFRRTLKELGFAEVWVTPIFDIEFDFKGKAVEVFNDMMKKLATVSGYHELGFAPVVPMGHSALASYPWNFAAGMPERTLAILSVHGDAPLTNLTGSGHPNPSWDDRNIDGIPGLMVEGEYEWMMARVQPALNYRQQHPASPISFLGDAGRGHFDYSDKLVEYLNLFLKKAAHYRLPEVMPLDKPAHLRTVDPSKGWLADRFRPDTVPHARAAPFGQYQGDRRQAFWYFDKEMADATEKYYAEVRGKKDQYIGFMQGDTLLRFNPRLHTRITPIFRPDTDGVTFHLQAVFTDSFRSRQSTDHASGKISISRICGPVQKMGDTSFRVQFYRMGLNNSKRSGDIWLLAENGGDAHYKSAVQQTNIHIAVANMEGSTQQIAFSEIGDQCLPLHALPLSATASSGLKVHYYVQEGPAEIKNDTLWFTRIPPRSRFPIKVSVVAWQYGRASGQKVKTAEPVTQTFRIREPITRTRFAWSQGLSQRHNQDREFNSYLFVYFTGNDRGDEAIRFAISRDGYHYYALNNNQPVLLSQQISSTGGVRDPHILRGEDGRTFYMVATDMVSKNGWNSNRGMVLLKSTDLIHWTSTTIDIQKRFSNQDSLLRVWAPQTIYDRNAGKYMIYWSMKYGVQADKLYFAYTNSEFTDLETFPKQLLYNPGGGATIDGDIIEKDNKYYLFFKTEGAKTSGIKIAVSDSLTSGYKVNENYVQRTTDAVEGSGTFRLNDGSGYILMYDVYMKGKYQFTRSKDLEHFEVMDKNVFMNFHPRHGTVMPITNEEADRIMAVWVSKRAYRRRERRIFLKGR